MCVCTVTLLSLTKVLRWPVRVCVCMYVCVCVSVCVLPNVWECTLAVANQYDKMPEYNYNSVHTVYTCIGLFHYAIIDVS